MNDRLSRLILNWQSDGHDPQEAFDWTSRLQSWKAKFPNYSNYFEYVLPSELDRETVRSICWSPKHNIVEKFLAVMVWGYGDRGYGPFRADIMLSQPHAEKTLKNTFLMANAGKPKDAYKYLMDNRIRILGPSFGTKFLSFCTPREIGAPIFDSFVGRWISAYAREDFEGIPMNSETWNCRTYFAYWNWVKEHSDYFNCYPDDVELVLFRDAESQFSRNSKWSGK